MSPVMAATARGSSALSAFEREARLLPLIAPMSPPPICSESYHAIETEKNGCQLHGGHQCTGKGNGLCRPAKNDVQTLAGACNAFRQPSLSPTRNTDDACHLPPLAWPPYGDLAHRLLHVRKGWKAHPSHYAGLRRALPPHLERRGSWRWSAELHTACFRCR